MDTISICKRYHQEAMTLVHTITSWSTLCQGAMEIPGHSGNGLDLHRGSSSTQCCPTGASQNCKALAPHLRPSGVPHTKLKGQVTNSRIAIWGEGGRRPGVPSQKAESLVPTFDEVVSCHLHSSSRLADLVPSDNLTDCPKSSSTNPRKNRRGPSPDTHQALSP